MLEVVVVTKQSRSGQHAAPHPEDERAGEEPSSSGAAGRPETQARRLCDRMMHAARCRRGGMRRGAAPCRAAGVPSPRDSRLR
jgi:hypothetical protein